MKKNVNLKDGLFKMKELKLYNLTDEEIKTILDYQKDLPILQCKIGEEENKVIDARRLHEQLKVKTEFAKWIKRRIEKYKFIENIDFTTFVKFDEREGNNLKSKSIEFNISLDMAKQLVMVENNEIGILARKYFIAIEKAFKNRYAWNTERDFTIQMCKSLKNALYVKREELEEYIPNWFMGNTYSFEFNLINSVIIKMSAKQYRKENKLTSTEPIRNTFNENTLYLIHKLEEYDSILINIQGMFNWELRKPLLEKYYQTIK